MKFDLDVITRKGSADCTVLPTEEKNNFIYILSNNQSLASELYNGIAAAFDSSKRFSTEDFNEIVDQLSSESKAMLKKSDSVLAVYNAAGCFIAQTGKARALQVRPETQEIVFDSRNLVLDIYSSKAKVCQLTDYAAGDLLLLSSHEDFDAKVVRKVLSDSELSLQGKHEKLKQVNGLSSESSVLIGAINVHSTFSFAFLKKINAKYVGYTLLVALIIAIVAWVVLCNPFRSSDGGIVVNEDSLVNVNSPHNADTTIKVVADTPTVAPQDTVKKAAEVKSAKKPKSSEPKLAETDNSTEAVKEQHEANPQPAAGASSAKPASVQPAPVAKEPAEATSGTATDGQ